MRKLLPMMFLALLTMMVLSSSVDGDDVVPAVVTTADVDPVLTDSVLDSAQIASSQIIAYYFYGNRRCATCKKLEEYSYEALAAAFPKLLESGEMVWRPVNIDEDENQHFIEDYQLYTKAVILSRTEGEKETGWTNLDKIWELVGDHDKYVTYIQTQARAFINPESDD